MEEHRYRWRIGRMCSLLNLSRSGFYAWQKSPRSERSIHNEGLIVEIHRVHIAARPALEGHRNDLARLGIVAEAGRIRHADEFVFHDRIDDLERLRHDALQRLTVRAVGDDQIFPVHEPIGTRRIGRVLERHRERAAQDLVDLDGGAPQAR